MGTIKTAYRIQGFRARNLTRKWEFRRNSCVDCIAGVGSGVVSAGVVEQSQWERSHQHVSLVSPWKCYVLVRNLEKTAAVVMLAVA